MTTIEEIQDHLKMTDGFDLFYRRWKAVGDIQRVVVCIHGFGFNSSTFKFMAEALAGDANEVYALDLRGFGNSVEQGLQRGDTSNFRRHLQDIDEAVGHIRTSHPGKKILMFGHSMGGSYTLWYAANHSRSLDGMILTGPPVESKEKFPLSFGIRILFAILFARKTMFDFSKIWPKYYIESEEFRILRQDPLTTSSFSVRYLLGTRRIGNGTLPNASRTSEPALILQGDLDDEVLPSGAKTLLETLGTKDKSLQTFADAEHYFYHTIFPGPTSQDDPKKRQHVTEVICNWLKSH